MSDDTSDHAVESIASLLREALVGQYGAALTMLRRAVERCPDDLWTQGKPAFWQVAYHAAFFAHFYLQRDEKSFVRWEHHREDYHFLGPLPWPPHREPNIRAPYTKAQVLEYLTKVEEMVAPAVNALDLASRESGFPWYKMSKLEHQMVNVRHIQHHAAHLTARLRSVTGETVGWVGTAEPGKGT